MSFRVPWGLVALLLVGADFASLWWLYGTVRAAGYHVLLALAATMLYVFAGFAAGAWTLRVGGVASFWNVMRKGVIGSEASRAMLNGLLVLAAGLLLMFPGLVSDVFAVLLLLPPTRAPFRRLIRHRAVVTTHGVQFGFGGMRHTPPPPRPGPTRPERDGDVDVDVDDYRVE